MNENIFRVKIASMFVEMYYNKIKSLFCTKLNETNDFNELVIKLKKCVMIENEEYHNLSEKDLKTILVKLAEDGINNGTEVRMSNKIIYEKKNRENFKVKKDILLSDVITTKVLIDVLKRMDKKMEILKSESDINDEDMLMLEIYNDAHKINYLSSNNYIESISLKHLFNIKTIPTIYFNDIEDEFNVTFIAESKSIFLDYAKDSIKEMASLKPDNLYLTAYALLFELSRTEVILEYLDYDNVKKLLSFLDYNYDTDNNQVLETAKKLIKKRKEELQ